MHLLEHEPKRGILGGLERRGGDNAELLREIEEQTDVCNRNMLDVQSLISRFPAGSRKFNVLTLKYIDGLSCLKISNRLYLSESAVRKLETQAVDELADHVSI